MERGECREGDHHTQRSSSFFVDQLSSHTWLPRLPQLFTDVLATALLPAAPSCTPRPVFTGATASIFPMALFLGGASHKALRHGVPASNKPHPAEKSTPVWLAIWYIWAGFANSQLQCATFHSNYSYKCTSTLLPPCNRCSDIANLSAHLHRLPTPPTYLRRMRLPPGQGRRCLVLDEACRLTGVQVLYAGYGCSLAGGGVPANHRARESLF